MGDTPWLEDACSLVDAFRAGERSPVEELDAVIAAIEASDLNAFAHLDLDRARELTATADLSLPFGGLPFGIKELEQVEGWPYTEASLAFKDRIGAYDTTMVQRVKSAGVVPVGSTTASEFGGLNVSVTRINGVTGNAWDPTKSAGGSSGGSAAAVAGGLLPLACGGDGGGSIRIPAGYNGLVGMKGTYGRIPRGPHTSLNPHTVVLGCLARSVRDAARYYDVTAGHDAHDPTSLPRVEGWEALLGSHDLRGRTVVIDPTFGGVAVDAAARAVVDEAADALVADLGLVRLDLPVDIPRMGGEWMMGNISSLYGELGDRWPDCAYDLTDEIRVGVQLSENLFNMRVAAEAEMVRRRANTAMAELFEQADFVITSSNPGPAFPAADGMSSDAKTFIDYARGNTAIQRAFSGVLKAARAVSGFAPKTPQRLLSAGTKGSPELLDMGALTMPANLSGNPAVSIPVGDVGGLPIGMQVIGRHHEDALLLDLARHVEQSRPWPFVAPGAPI
ncbi:MAG: amidase [Acidimicrobiales bacterium]|jgi:Asp-tRNA(Asn)/Glu-tRNA(Gln) amidotransferase A subunit family amidase|nr:amidase [Acidimicrobiales bacterium]